MTSSVERKKHRRSESNSSEERSRSRSRDRKKRKKEKKRRRSRSRSRSRSKEKKNKKESKSKKSSRRKDKRDRSNSESSKSLSESRHKMQSLDPSMMGAYMYYPGMPPPKDGRMVRPPMFYPPEAFIRPNKMVQNPVKPIEIQNLEVPTDKIVKDQNFLNSDEKLFESIINNEMHIRTVFEEVQISESLAGSTLYKTLKKLLYDPSTTIFDSEGSNKIIAKENYIGSISEYIKLEINDYLTRNSDDILKTKPGEFSEIKEELIKLKNLKNTNNQI
jgi:hypothetical protein